MGELFEEIDFGASHLNIRSVLPNLNELRVLLENANRLSMVFGE